MSASCTSTVVISVLALFTANVAYAGFRIPFVSTCNLVVITDNFVVLSVSNSVVVSFNQGSVFRFACIDDGVVLNVCIVSGLRKVNYFIGVTGLNSVDTCFSVGNSSILEFDRGVRNVLLVQSLFVFKFGSSVFVELIYLSEFFVVNGFINRVDAYVIEECITHNFVTTCTKTEFEVNRLEVGGFVCLEVIGKFCPLAGLFGSSISCQGSVLVLIVSYVFAVNDNEVAVSIFSPSIVRSVYVEGIGVVTDRNGYECFCIIIQIIGACVYVDSVMTVALQGDRAGGVGVIAGVEVVDNQNAVCSIKCATDKFRSVSAIFNVVIEEHILCQSGAINDFVVLFDTCFFVFGDLMTDTKHIVVIVDGLRVDDTCNLVVAVCGRTCCCTGTGPLVGGCRLACIFVTGEGVGDKAYGRDFVDSVVVFIFGDGVLAYGVNQDCTAVSSVFILFGTNAEGEFATCASHDTVVNVEYNFLPLAVGSNGLCDRMSVVGGYVKGDFSLKG